MKLVSCADMQLLDADTQKHLSIPGLLLMENAGIRLFDYCRQHLFKQKSRLLFLLGSGNNGGDALVMARQAYLAGYPLTLLYAKKQNGDTVTIHQRILEGLKVPAFVFEEDKIAAEKLFADADWVIDGLLGTGLSSAVMGQVSKLIDLVNASSCQVCSIDLPSGIRSGFGKNDNAVMADIVLTVELAKWELYTPYSRPYAKAIVPVPIGFPDSMKEKTKLTATLIDKSDIEKIIRPIQPGQYKNQRGHVQIVAGSQGFHGAAVLCAKAASVMRAGLVSLELPEEIWLPAAAQLSNVMLKTERKTLDNVQSFCVGPGSVQDPLLKQRVQQLCASSLPGVLDAQALRILDADIAAGNSRLVLTPHPAELAALTGCELDDISASLLEVLERTAAAYKAVLVLKTSLVYIYSTEQGLSVIDGNNPAMGTGGSGDVLAGAIAALLAAGYSPYNAALLAAWVHQEAGRIAADKWGYFTAEALPCLMGQILYDLEKNERRE